MKKILLKLKVPNTRVNAFLWVFLCIALMLSIAYQINHKVKFESNILKLLPATDNSAMLDIAFTNFAEKNMQQVIFLIANDNDDSAISSANHLAEYLESSHYIDEVSAKISSENQQEIGKIIYQFRYHLLNNRDKQLLIDHKYSVFTNEMLQTIFSPVSAGVTRLINTDPFLLSYRYSQSQQSDAALKLKNGYLMTEYLGQFYVLVTAKLNASAFDPKIQDGVISGLNAIEKHWLEEKLPSQLIRTGALFYADFAYRTAKKEISTIGISSILLIIGMVFFAFRNLRPLFLICVALTFGIGSGLSATLTIFGHIHLLTLVFGASLIGVAVDYAFHFFVVENKYQGLNRLRQILPAISLGLLSSVTGYIALLSTPFPGLQQMAVFCIVGLIAAFLTVVLIYPQIKLNINLSTGLLDLCQSIINLKIWQSTQTLWYSLWLLPIIAIILSVNDDSQQDNIRQFRTINPNLEKQEQLIKNIFKPAAANQFYLVIGKTEEELLVNLESANSSLEKLVEQEVISGFENLSQQLPSLAQQSKNYQLIKNLYASNASDKLHQLGILNELEYREIVNSFETNSSAFLTTDHWFKSHLGKVYAHLWLGQISNVYAAIIPLKIVLKLEQLKDINKNAIFVDKVSKITAVFSKYRQRTSQLLMIAILLIGTLLSFRYGIKKALFIVSSPIFALSITVIVLSLIGISMTLFNTLALFLVVGIGIDYGLFFAESKHMSSRVLMAILLSALTTMFSFGLLALSETVAIRAFGITMLIGISSSFILSVAIGYLVVGHHKDET